MKINLGNEQVEVQMIRSRRKTCEIRITPGGDLQVRGPLRISDKKLMDLVKDKSGWITGKLEALRKNPPNRQGREFVTGAPYPYLGRAYPLQIVEDSSVTRVRVQLTAEEFRITAPTRDPVLIRGALEKWCRQQAGPIFQERIRTLERVMGLKCAQITVKNQKMRWGSCSSRGNLNLNWRLIQMPLAVMDSVLIHELAHLVHPNHSADYYRYLSRYNPDYKDHDRWLKKQGRELFL